MRNLWIKRVAMLAIAISTIAGLGWFAWPSPVPVDLVTISRGPMEVTVEEEARTRVRHVYAVSAPIAGKVLRISPPRHVGEEVVADETPVALMQPTLPSFHDARTHEELQAALAAAEATVRLADAEVRRTGAALAFARSELQRATTLARTETVSQKALDKAKFDAESGEAALASAKAQLEVRRSERDSVAARLAEPSGGAAQVGSACCIHLRTPVTGRILRIVQDSEGVVPAGTPLVEIGDPLDLEVVADLLSSDAVQIERGWAVRIDGWGGPPMRGRIVRVDPAGFLKVSALGIEEQRVRTTIELVDPPAVWSRLGHDFRVIVHVVVWRDEAALIVPVGALFRRGEEWAVFAMRDGRARATPVQVGKRNARTAQVVSGLTEGEIVVLHPSDRVRDGSAVAQRQVR